jgi:hypothetical protein
MGKGVCHCQMNGIQILVFGFDFNHSLDYVTLPGSLQNLILGHQFN